MGIFSPFHSSSSLINSLEFAEGLAIADSGDILTSIPWSLLKQG